MPIVPVRRAWTTQPQYSAKITPEFSASFTGGYLGSVPRELRSGAQNFSGFVPEITGQGRTWRNSGAVVTLAAAAEPIVPTGSSVTFLLQGYKIADISGGYYSGTIGLDRSAADASDVFAIYLPYLGAGGNPVYWRWGGASEGSTQLSVSSLSFAQSDWWAFTSGARGMEIWQNGNLVGSNGATPSRTSSGVALIVGEGFHPASSPYTELKFSAALWFNKQFPKEFLANRNYWRVFEP